ITFSETEIRVASSLSIGDLAQNEAQSGTTTFTFTVSLDVPSADDVSFSYALAHDTTNADDFSGTLSGSGTISAGQSSTTIGIEVAGDRVAEANETFFVNLSDVVGA